MKTDFPTVELENGSVTIYGIRHRFDNYKPPRQLRRILGRAIGRIDPNDYLLVEGSPYVSINPPKLRAPNMVIRFLSDVPQIYDSPNLEDRTETPEWYLEPMFNDMDRQVDMILVGRARKGTVKLDDSDAFKPQQPDDVKRFKAEFVREIGKTTDIPAEVLRMHIEKRYTFRSALMSRIAFYRATALNGHVRNFMGRDHAGEIRTFLENPAYLIEYATSLPDELRQLYEQNEVLQRKITNLFRNLRDISEHRAVVLRQIVHRMLQEETARVGAAIGTMV